MGIEDDICVGMKEIVRFFQELKMISRNVTPHKGWNYVKRWQKNKGLGDIMYKMPQNDKPMIIKSEIREWIRRYNEIKSRKMKK